MPYSSLYHCRDIHSISIDLHKSKLLDLDSGIGHKYRYNDSTDVYTESSPFSAYKLHPLANFYIMRSIPSVRMPPPFKILDLPTQKPVHPQKPFSNFSTSVCIHYPKNLVFTAAILTSALVIGLTLYAMYTDTDFTMMGGILFAGSLVLLAASFIAAFIQIKILNLVISVFSVLLFGVYLIYDTQLVIGGERRKMEIGIDDYIMGALILYIDIITIFIQIL